MSFSLAFQGASIPKPIERGQIRDFNISIEFELTQNTVKTETYELSSTRPLVLRECIVSMILPENDWNKGISVRAMLKDSDDKRRLNYILVSGYIVKNDDGEFAKTIEMPRHRYIPLGGSPFVEFKAWKPSNKAGVVNLYGVYEAL